MLQILISSFMRYQTYILEAHVLYISMLIIEDCDLNISFFRILKLRQLNMEL